MANEQNLVPFTSDQNREEAAKNGMKGGKASGEARRAKRTLRELAEYFGTLKPSEKAIEELEKMGIDPDKFTKDMQITISLYNKAMKGDVSAFNAIRDLRGEKPADNVSVGFPTALELRQMPANGVEIVTNEKDVQQ